MCSQWHGSLRRSVGPTQRIAARRYRTRRYCTCCNRSSRCRSRPRSSVSSNSSTHSSLRPVADSSSDPPTNGHPNAPFWSRGLDRKPSEAMGAIPRLQVERHRRHRSVHPHSPARSEGSEDQADHYPRPGHPGRSRTRGFCNEASPDYQEASFIGPQRGYRCQAGVWKPGLVCEVPSQGQEGPKEGSSCS